MCLTGDLKKLHVKAGSQFDSIIFAADVVNR